MSTPVIISHVTDLPSYVRQVWSYRHFWMNLVRGDLRSRYRGSLLGIGWSLLNPLMMMGTLCFVFHNLFHLDATTYIPYLLTGLAFWGFFSSAVGQGCHTFRMAEQYIRQQPVPLAIYPLRTMLGAAVHYGITFCTVILFCLFLVGVPSLGGICTLPLAILVQMLFIWSIVVLVGFASVHFPDFEHAISVLMQLMFYATPVIWPASVMEERGLGAFVKCNPLAAMIEILRAPLVGGQAAGWETWGVCVALVAVAGTAALLVLAKCERRLVYYL